LGFSSLIGGIASYFIYAREEAYLQALVDEAAFEFRELQQNVIERADRLLAVKTP
jgi:hypothetical protein